MTGIGGGDWGCRWIMQSMTDIASVTHTVGSLGVGLLYSCFMAFLLTKICGWVWWRYGLYLILLISLNGSTLTSLLVLYSFMFYRIMHTYDYSDDDYLQLIKNISWQTCFQICSSFQPVCIWCVLTCLAMRALHALVRWTIPLRARSKGYIRYCLLSFLNVHVLILFYFGCSSEQIKFLMCVWKYPLETEKTIDSWMHCDSLLKDSTSVHIITCTHQAWNFYTAVPHISNEK